MTLLARIKVHTQQICGLAWSPNGEQFATGGNDNLCCLFSVEKILGAEDGSGDMRAQGAGSSSGSRSSSAHLPVVSTVSRDRILPTTDASTHQLSSARGPTSTPAPTSQNPTLPPGLLAGWPAGHPSQTSPGGQVVHQGSESDRLPSAASSSPQPFTVRTWRSSAVLQTWRHLAAVKAIAFCPWRPHLLATGGGSNDKMIHFFHTTSGAALASISVSAQVTSLVWSKTRREIAATFGYAQPDHEVRIAIFSWPDCKMVGCVRWEGEHRALFAVAYPRGPTGLPVSSRAANSSSSAAGEGTSAETRSLQRDHTNTRRGPRRRSGTEQEGCLIVAGSDESIKFHEVWGAGRGKTTEVLGPGALGGSDIIEMAEGIDKEGDIIR